jgi:hypothetical protein
MLRLQALLPGSNERTDRRSMMRAVRRRVAQRDLDLRRRVAQRGLRPVARRLGFDVIERDYYSPVPRMEDLSPALWEKPSELRGINFDAGAQMEFLEQDLAAHILEYKPPNNPTGRPGEFHLENNFYGPVDAEVLYGMIRHFRPRRIVELGSGDSTLVVRDANQSNAANGGQRAEHLVFDPYPRPELEPIIRSFAALQATSAAEIPLSLFRSLERNDILFVDTTHTVKVGGEVNFLVLDALPTIGPGVVVHFHDIFLPWEYPREWITLERLERYWAEQYLLQAFLAFNPLWEVLFAAYAVTRAFPDRLASTVPSLRTAHGPEVVYPAGIWLRRSEADY